MEAGAEANVYEELVTESEKSNVVGLREPDKIRAGLMQKEPCEVLITHLEDLLKLAREGWLQGVMYVTINHRETVDYNEVGNLQRYKMLGGVEQMKFAILKELDAEIETPAPDGVA